jgi:thiol:disulfide interchange protein
MIFKSHFRIATRRTMGLKIAGLLLSAFALLLVVNASMPAQAQSAMPFVKKHIYSATANPTADIAAALKKATAEHKRVILDFGGDWCGDCQVLDIYFHQSPNAALLAKHFVLVHIYIGQMDANLDVAKKYKVPINKGVPALAVLDAHGKLLYSQQTGQFENMRNMSIQSVTEFLNKWKA